MLRHAASRCGTVLSHDAFLLISEINEADSPLTIDDLEWRVRKRLTDDFVQAWENLLDNGWVTTQLSVADKLQCEIKLTTKKQISLINKLNKTDKLQEQLNVASFIKRTVNPRNFSAPYQAVVENKAPRNTPLKKFVEAMTPLDQADFWEAYMKADEKTKRSIDNRISLASTRRR